jgi:outer membrane immunogenic protein
VVISCTDKIKSFGDVTGRVGFTVDKALVYIKGGWAWAETDFNANFNIAGVGGSATVNNLSRSGAVLGTGVEYAFLPNWSAKVEYD